MALNSGTSTGWLFVHCVQIELEFRNLDFWGEPGEKHLGARARTNKTQPTSDAESGNRTRATLVGGECSHHCAIPAPQDKLRPRNMNYNM